MAADNTVLVETLVAFGNDVVERAQRNLGATRRVKGKNRRAVASGNLKNSLTFSLRKTGEGYTIQFKARGTAAKYAEVIEDGRRAGAKAPPIEPILAWIKLKNIKARDEKGRILEQTESRKRGLAFAIARGIGKNGIEAVKYFENAYNDAIEEREPDIYKALTEYLNKRFEK